MIIPYKNIWKFFYEDIYNVLDELTPENVRRTIQILIKVPTEKYRNINYYLAQKLNHYSDGTSAYSSLQLGIYYLNGIYSL